MTTIPAIDARPARRTGRGEFARWLGQVANGLVAYWVRRQAVKALLELDDRALHDLGICRSQIETAVYGGVMNPESGRRG
jgi:uncharacterized protein YjiS (DUF1127 family)